MHAFSTSVLIARLRSQHGESLLVMRSAPGGRPGRVICRALLVQHTGEVLTACTVADLRRRGRRRRSWRPARCRRRGWLVLVRVPEPERARAAAVPGTCTADAREPRASGICARASFMLVGLHPFDGRCRSAAMHRARLQRYRRMRRHAPILRS